MSYVYAYMTEAERMEAYENAQFENAMLKIDALFERVDTEHRIRIHNIETELYVRECGSDELSKIYEKEMELYTEGVKEAWDKFISFIRNLLHKIGEKLGLIKKVEDKKKKFPIDIDLKAVNACVKDVNKAVDKFITSKTGKFTLTIGGIVGGIGTAYTIKDAISKAKEKTGSSASVKNMDVEEIGSILDDTLNVANDTVEKVEKAAKATAGDNENGVLQGLREAVQGVLSWVHDTVNKIRGKLGLKSLEDVAADRALKAEDKQAKKDAKQREANIANAENSQRAADHARNKDNVSDMDKLIANSIKELSKYVKANRKQIPGLPKTGKLKVADYDKVLDYARHHDVDDQTITNWRTAIAQLVNEATGILDIDRVSFETILEYCGIVIDDGEVVTESAEDELMAFIESL